MTTKQSLQEDIQRLRAIDAERVAALKVIVLTPHIGAYLLANDPKALEQVCHAIGVTLADVRAIVADRAVR